MKQRINVYRSLSVESLEFRSLLASLTGFSFIDSDGDGQRGPDETGLPGVRVELRSESGAETEPQIAITSDQGFYAFTDLPAGTFGVSAQQPVALDDGPESASFVGAVIEDDAIANIELGESDIATEINFAESGIKSAYVSAVWVFSSSGQSDYGALLRDLVADVEQVSGNVALASQIRNSAGAETRPIATMDRYEAVAGVELSVPPTSGVLQNDFDPTGSPITVELVSPPASGSISLSPDGSFLYTANIDFDGPDSFTYRAVGDGVSTPTTVRVEVSAPPNRAPVAEEESFQVSEDNTLAIGAPGVLENDIDADGDDLTAVVVQEPIDGSLLLNADGSFEYVPDANFFGADSFTYVAMDGETQSAEVTVQITINAVNDAPQGVTEAYVTNENESLTILAADGVLANDTDIDGDTLTAIVRDDATNGAVTLAADGSFTYLPNPGFSGFDSFTYVVNDGSESSGPVTVTIDVGSVNDAPVANADQFSTDEDTTLSETNANVLGNDVDIDGDMLTAEVIQEPANGTLVLNSDGTFEYTPNANFTGDETFTYVASDGLRSSDPAVVTITVRPVNDAPVAENDQYQLSQGETLLIDQTAGVLANDSDVENDQLTATPGTGPENGQVVLDADGSFEYTPADGFSGTDTFSYQANDGTLDSNTAIVTITVTSVNTAPQAENDTYEVNENEVLTISVTNGVLANDTDSDGDQLSAQITAEPTNGSVTLNADGSFDYTPSANFSGTDSFRYVANDSIESSAEATVNITVIAAPVIVTETVTLGASKDNSLFESSTGSLSNGAGEYLFVGKTLQAENFLRRALIAFDFASIPAGATITDVSLTLNMSRTIVGAFDVTLHRVAQDWGEGTSDAAAEEGTGIDSTTQDATWLHAFFDSQTWETPGGDFVAEASALTPVDGVGSYTWNSTQMAADVQSWLDDPSSNAGWIVVTDENEITAKRFDSRENPIEANRPQLVVEYETATVVQAALATTDATNNATSNATNEAEPFDEVFATAVETLPGDSNLDGEVNFLDFLAIAGNFGKTDAAWTDGDFDGNGNVDFSDLLVLAGNFERA